MKRERMHSARISASLAKVPVFGALQEEECAALAETVESRICEVGEWLFRQGERADGFYAVCEGTVKVFRLGEGGREQVLHMLSPGDLVGEVPVFQGGKYPANAVMADSGKVLYIPGDSFLEHAESHPTILLEMLAMLSKRLRGFVQLIDDLSLKEVSARVAKHLLDLSARQDSSTVTLECSKTMLAARLGTIAETLSRTLGKLQKRGVIDVDGRDIHLLDFEQLARFAAGMKL